MAVLTLPTRADFDRYSFTVELEGSIYAFTFRWSTREGAWYFDLADANGDLVVAGQKVTVDTPWLRNVQDARKPPGDLFALDTNGGGEPVQADLGTRVVLVYVESE